MERPKRIDRLNKKRSAPQRGIDWRTILFSSTIPLLLTLGALESVWTDMSHYDSTFLSNRFDYSSSVRTTERLIAYFKEPLDSEIGIPAFNKREADHLRDVKILLKGACIVFGTLLLVWLIFLAIDPTRAGKGLVLGGVAGIILLGGLTLMPFEFLFYQFHTILFPAGTWTFPPNSLIITIYPFQLFHHLAEVILWRTLFLHLATIGAGYTLLGMLNRSIKSSPPV